MEEKRSRLWVRNENYTNLDHSIWEDKHSIRVFLIWGAASLLPLEANQDLERLTTMESDCGKKSVRIKFLQIILNYVRFDWFTYYL